MKSNWQPTASINNLKIRAQVLATIRAFFAERDVLEVDTPLLSAGTVTDPYLRSMTSEFIWDGDSSGKTLYLQTSPEFAMKRLLAADSGAIYQICKAFRNGEAGTQHNPEFTILEWYRPGFNHHDLMDEMDALLQAVLQCPMAERLSYQDAFARQCDINPHKTTLAELEAVAAAFKLTITEAFNRDDKDSWLDLLMSHVIEQDLGRDGPCFIYDYPASQAALAKVRQDTIPVAERFEVYINGVELANGFHELTDSSEQATRFRQDLAKRQQLGLEQVPIDNNLLDALQHGLPDCAGVALGIDRLVMLACNTCNIRDVLSFPLERA